ncbi:SDR family NAD(P)-dependent oxidoreductase [Nocardioides daphniae]|uniref:SDR family NAD(P)-dependent oxidoreductase n=1 Tax=Nocardioides daphniae TaxID=402297 RepID=A0A4P7UB92_9ACTN|nr:SDR family NAD(P)-dependent oxidoreductase [Nocardioides daphniae]QCC76528.1 SDR family NAD(P)-dependent oxidoreductase [Nocardioides daphniae]GGD05726.1 putative short-chain dehydrogenase/reductase [Nocardioides daphniae]
MRSLSGKVVVITGAGSGIGRALALRCAQQGSRLALSDIDAPSLAETALLASQVGAKSVHTEVVDVASAEAVHAWADAVVEHYGWVDAVINNAGVSLSGDFLDLEPKDMEWIMAINFWGVVHGSRAFLPHLIASGDGHLVNVSSLFGLVSMPSQSLYNASKYAVRGLSESLREEMLVAGHPVHVTVVHPGGIKTAIARNGRCAPGEDQSELARKFDEQLARTTPDEAARVILRGMLAGKPRVLVGADAHVVHTLAKLVGARYQDVAARLSKRFDAR